MVHNNKYIEQLKTNLKAIDPYMVLLFGSYAYGNPDEDSDLDLFVVLNDYSMPATFSEKQQLYLKVSQLTRPIAKQIPLDLVVFTIPMFEQFKHANTNFSEEILTKGIVIYESEHQTMV
jgi:predicted nucleotidyltransferase